MAAGPFAEIDEAAAVAAEGEVGVGRENKFAAGRAAERLGFVLWHGVSS